MTEGRVRGASGAAARDRTTAATSSSVPHRGQSARAADPTALMAVVTARLLRDGECVFVGIGLPNVACNLARRLHAPNLQMLYESGVYGADPERQPLSIGDPCLVTGAVAVTGMAQVFTLFLQRGLVDVGVLGAAQVDRYGNVNTTVIGEYGSPRVRLPGSGGACEIAHLARATLILAPLRRRSFPERVDFVTSPGFLQGGRDARARRGIAGGGPRAVITDRCVLRPDPDSGELLLSELYPGVSEAEVRAEIQWPLRAATEVGCTPPPTPEELAVLQRLRPAAAAP